MKISKCSSFIVLLIIATALNPLMGLSKSQTEEDLTITYQQKLSLDKFTARLLPILPHAYMRKDLYLLKWLRAKKFRVDEAEAFFKQNLKWRKANKMDGINEEDFSEMLAKIPIHVDTYDKQGAPVVTAPSGGWDLREFLVTGTAERLHRLRYKILEEASLKVRQAQEDGKNVTRFHLILNMDGFNLVQHGCPRCIVETVHFIQTYENYYPGMIEKVVIINAPPQLHVLRNAARQTLSPEVRRHFSLFGTEKGEWQRFLLKFIDAHELTEAYGGTRVRE